MSDPTDLRANHHCDEEEEAINAISHGLGAAAAFIALVAMIAIAWERADGWGVISAGLHGGSLLAVLGTSAIYHALPRGYWKQVFQVADHVAIYGLIAGSTAPMGLIIDSVTGTTILTLQALIAIVGIGLKLVFGVHRFPWVSVGMYLAAGWCGVMALPEVLMVLPWDGLAWLVAGGLFYTAGVVFFVWESLRYNHFVWHLFVLFGAACHCWVSMGYVLPA